ncbi:hypothetical protein NIES4075_62590 [Tolypothrix sp. NIES-4075]|uniref:hypothetical protein n=1 Tax=Tolypothrix sp. NIES-4075 TaxID=2005459 RepID=UPI000B5CB637|nr:hypothetical protein [Tolypothrix sp. NIES-4075]GAX45238.1 hypothetical protein NIES4075_62590 [Tolypothrix sp. NIES-4075]
MSYSNSTVDLDTLLRTLTQDSEQVALNTNCIENKTNVQNPLSRENLLSEVEALELRRLEARVELGLKAFWEIGQALSQIRDKRLYRETHKTFEEYCITRWEMSRRSAYQLIGAAIVVENVRNCAQILPLNEAQARPLVALPPEQQREAWKTAVSTAANGKVTAVHVAQVAREYHRASVPTTSRNKNTFDQQKQSAKNSTPSITPSCWNCSHCSREFVDNPQNFYCYQLGKLNFIEKNGNQRAAECELWTYRGGESAQIKKPRLPLRETFTLTLQLPADLQPLIQDAAKESGLVVVDWVAKVLSEAVFTSHATQSTHIHQDFIDVSGSEVA